MKKILIQQRYDDRIVFFTDESTEKTVLQYKKFVDYIKDFLIKDAKEFFINIDKFNIILLDVVTGEWEVKKKLNECDINTFKEMCQTEQVIIHSSNEEYLENKNTEDQKEVSSFDSVVNQAKQFIDTLYVRNKENATNVYRRKG